MTDFAADKHSIFKSRLYTNWASDYYGE